MIKDLYLHRLGTALIGGFFVAGAALLLLASAPFALLGIILIGLGAASLGVLRELTEEQAKQGGRGVSKEMIRRFNWRGDIREWLEGGAVLVLVLAILRWVTT
ncbi:hypothetical protein JCM17845_15590 [Iodidimonas gelatinilytica]|uniref:Uncharacterized protein n=1 Tax=Iodidimonas gelatinilytica TaxID=1236966 RepID=A0A5A7N1J4_9PROT|nr:hypothetical protein [Iodidimonas gelatinilytica]GER00936.1 hypothetical protein JCM17845_15590 [Iodidimonas gelatinilytica]